MVKRRVVRGDTVTVPTAYGDRIGEASHIDGQGRWVIWRDGGSHWAAGVYEPADVIWCGDPAASQVQLPVDPADARRRR